MTQEDKDLLIKDLCTRLPYGVKIKVDKIDSPVSLFCIDKDKGIVFDRVWTYPFEICKPYLFPTTLITKEQKEDLYKYSGFDIDTDEATIKIDPIYIFDWLNANHFDYRGLIDKGLAIDATNLGIYEN